MSNIAKDLSRLGTSCHTLELADGRRYGHIGALPARLAVVSMGGLIMGSLVMLNQCYYGVMTCSENQPALIWLHDLQ
ncbi:hypothetical protein DPMN_154825 [Dreissena polymorpha]|uniref:Uncharacterized protein n=1 Tax=Dreissena polymorpha TaxID=45954 RepID=A0A9D4FQ15_DREPO|nr:hypothetical protein DPMN_154825 [Dreissena polymorpha]